MVMFTACFDGSGQRSDKFMVVSGYVANFQQWKMLETCWKDLHSEYGVDLPFHMADFSAACGDPDRYAKQKKFRADYVRLARDTKSAMEFLHKLAIIQVAAMHCGISCIIPMEIYNDVSTLLPLDEVVPPYALGARMCIERLRQWKEMFAICEPVEYVFEYGDFGQAKFTELMEVEGEQTPIYKHKDEFIGLQAADYYSWQQFLVLKKHLADSAYIPRDEVSMLIWGIPKPSVITSKAANGCHFKTGQRKGPGT